MTPLEIAANVVTTLSIWLAARNSRHTWSTGIVGCVLFGVQFFRSQRGRTITHAHHFDLGDRELPEVRADDDAASVEWVPVAQLAAMEDRFFDDHFHMLDHFLGLTRA